MKLTYDDISFILNSLQFTRMKFENYPYEKYEIRRARLDEVDALIEKLIQMKKETKDENPVRSH